MILKLTLKDTQALDSLTSEEREAAQRWFKWSEYVTIEFDTETGVGKVIKP